MLEKWMGIVKNKTILWEVVETVDLAEREPVLFDFTVPEGETFCIDNGLITHNTMTVHMPITDEAVQESMKMLPSRNLYQPGTNKLIVSPSQESQLGIYYLSQTDAGRKRLNAILGSKFAISAPLNKGSTAALLASINKQDPKSFVKILQDLKTIGDIHAYDIGFTVGLSDLPSLGKQRDVILKNISSDLKGASVARMAEINASTTKQVDDMLEHNLKGKGNAFYDMVTSGARGDKSQLRSILASPLFVSDAKGKTIHTAIGKSYSEGLDIGDYWVSLYGARRGMMDRSIQTQLPGAFSKSVMASTIDNVVSAIDCGTKNGIMLSPESEEVLDRYLAGPQGGFAHNTLVDSTVRSKLKSLKEIKVRSPLTCLQAKGTCAKCYGLDEHGEHPHLGDNIGAKAGQAISEPLMQMTMNTFHTGGVAGTGMGATGIKRVDQLLKLPKIVTGSAALAPASGRITRIEPGVGGGHDIYIGDKSAHSSQGIKLKVKQGDTVAIGDALSEGVIKPQDLVAYKGMRSAQNYVVSELHKAYKDQGVSVQRKIFETVVRSLSNTTLVKNKPRNTNIIPGDLMPYTVVEHHNANLERELPVDEAIGHNLAIAYGSSPAGTEVTASIARALKAAGKTTVQVKLDAIEHEPVLKNIDTLPLLKKDWMGALGYRNLAKALTEGASQAWETDIHDYHPVPAFAYGAEFGKGEKGKY
jgi:DNA-directed RNA polymerase subunit beta'